mgnify:CR=1 FL=1
MADIPGLVELSIMIIKGWFGLFIIYISYKMLESLTSPNIVVVLFIALWVYVGSVIILKQSFKLMDF